MTAEDAVGLVDLVKATYGEEYPHEAIYRPSDFFAAQERGEHISEVAVTGEGQVVGHWAFVFHGPKVAESAMTITHPDFRGRGIAVSLEENLLERIGELGVSWIMGEPVLIHTATQEMVLNRWKDGAITGFRINAFHHVDAVTGFSEEEMEVGRVSVATGFGPIAEMEARTVWLAPPYARILSLVLDSNDWPRSIGEVDGAGELTLSGESVVESIWDEENASLRLDVPVIGADIVEVIGSARDEAVSRGARHIDLLLPVSRPESASVDLIPLGFSYAAFLPEMGWEGDLLLLQWLADPDVDRGHWHLASSDLEALADAIIAQAGEAAGSRASRK
jgi:predicted GNAT family acetyltransferase